MPEADRSASPPSSTRPPEGVDVSLNLAYVVGQLSGAIIPESDRSALLEFDLSSALLWAVAAADGTHSYFATDTSPAVIAKVRHSDLALVDVLVLDGVGERRNGSAAASYVRAGAMRPDGRASYWATH